MSGKQIGTIIGLIFLIPFLIGVFIFVIKMSIHPDDPKSLESGTELIVDAAVPWWIGIIEWLAGIPGIIGAVLIIGFLIFLKYIGEIKG